MTNTNGSTNDIQSVLAQAADGRRSSAREAADKLRLSLDIKRSKRDVAIDNCIKTFAKAVEAAREVSDLAGSLHQSYWQLAVEVLSELGQLPSTDGFYDMQKANIIIGGKQRDLMLADGVAHPHLYAGGYSTESKVIISALSNFCTISTEAQTELNAPKFVIKVGKDNADGSGNYVKSY